MELRVERLAAGGEGIARLEDGRIAFIAGSAPGDRVQARVVEEHARFVRAEVQALLEAGATRVEPRCAVFGVCGGCSWQHVDYAAQVAAKRAILRDALERIGGLDVPGDLCFEPSPVSYGYRRRVRLVAREGALYARRRRSHALCRIERCPVLLPALERALEAPPLPREREAREWELAVDDEGRLATAPVPGERRSPGRRLQLRVGAERIEVSPGVFLQAHALLTGKLADWVHEAAGRGHQALELYAGSGLFTLGLARRFQELTAVEASRVAAGDLRRNLERAGLHHVRVSTRPVERFLREARRAGLRPETVVLDPPRAGLSPAARQRLIELGPERLVYLSCDPATLARDLRALVAAGWRLRRVRGLDLFPQTPHVEALAELE